MTWSYVGGMDLSLFMICLYDSVKPLKNSVSKIIVGCFIRFYVLETHMMGVISWVSILGKRGQFLEIISVHWLNGFIFSPIFRYDVMIHVVVYILFFILKSTTRIMARSAVVYYVWLERNAYVFYSNVKYEEALNHKGLSWVCHNWGF